MKQELDKLLCERYPKIKDCNKHWKHQNDVTRLHYVKAAQ